MLKLKVIACDVFKREISYLSSLSECFVDVTYLCQGLHSTPDELRNMLQKEIDKVEEDGFPYNHFGKNPSYDFIILGYGLCSNSIVGLKSKSIPLIVPKAHDCTTLLLGSRELYNKYFSEGEGGVYWYSAGWIDCSMQPGKERYTETLKGYVEKYGEDNAEYLMEMEQNWFNEYGTAAFINWKCLENSERYRTYSKECAEYLNWKYLEIEGDTSLMSDILNGKFDDNVVIVSPEKEIKASHDDEIIGF